MVTDCGLVGLGWDFVVPDLEFGWTVEEGICHPPLKGPYRCWKNVLGTRRRRIMLCLQEKQGGPMTTLLRRTMLLDDSRLCPLLEPCGD